MSQRKPPPMKAVISRRVLLAAGGLVVLGEFIAGAGSSGANDAARPSANGSRSASRTPTPAPRAGQTTHPSNAAHPTSTPSDVSSSSAPARAGQSAETPTAHSTSGQPSQPMYYIDDGPKTIALTIDDGPSSIYTPQVLKLLQKYKITATFSMIGSQVAADPALAREVADAGHKVVNHTWTHANLPPLSASELSTQMQKAQDVIESAIRGKLTMFRAPYGAWSTAVLERCQQMNLTPLDWSVDPEDWARPGVSKIVSNIMKNTKTGSIILEHDGGGNRSQTVAALGIVIPELLDAGYRFRTA
ncbi:MAG TPA: polysaccharide deacetylase family protein [Streptosporangiaceae bacterium]|jgi:peptidoglycan/xylan/chitin deacetylase (PgdA/CDA1 family)|nr:polysaccharide deacetylase family protein [Streptosporangiaceae bacterium]